MRQYYEADLIGTDKNEILIVFTPMTLFMFLALILSLFLCIKVFINSLGVL